MRFFGIGQAFAKERQQQRQSEQLHNEAESFELAKEGGYWTVLKGALFLLLGYYNLRLFHVTIPGWEGWMTGVFALAAEATALYCVNNYTKSAGWHRFALGLFGALLIGFSISHATISFFRMETHGGASANVHFYCERVAFPLLFGLLVLAAVLIPLLRWRKQISAHQAKAQVRIASSRATLVAESAAMRDENALERERLKQLEEQTALEHEYLGALENMVALKQHEREIIENIADPDLREKLATKVGLTLPNSTFPKSLPNP